MKRIERKHEIRKIGKRKYLQIGIFLFLLAICFSVLYFLNLFPFGSDILAHDRLNILAVGTDSVENKSRADTILVLSLSPKTKETILFSIPRDMRVQIPGRGLDKINHAFFYGGIDLLEKTVESFTGLPIHYYGVMDFDGFQYIIDLIGGVSIDIEKDMYYVDQAGSLQINLHRGTQLLNGEKALEYVRFRYDPLGDLGRIQRQQKLINAVIDKGMNFDNMIKLPNMITSLTKYIDTNMNPNKIIDLVRLMKDIDREKIWVETITGEPKYIDGVSYLVTNEDEVRQRIKSLIENKNKGLNIEVLNGNHVPGIAHRVAEKMKELGFNVVNIDNADCFDYEKTILIIYSKKVHSIDYLKTYLDDVQIIRKEKPDSELDMTIIVGKNMVY